MTVESRHLFRTSVSAAALTLAELAARLGVSVSAVCRYRDGSRAVPKEVLARLAEVLREQARELEELANALERHEKEDR